MMNVPNKITLIRVILMPIFIFLYLADFIPFNKIIALFIFIVACFSDLLDGYIARKYNLVTDFGKFLDPIADKLLSNTGLIVLMMDNIIPNPFGIIFLFVMLLRDYLITGLRQLAQTKGVIIAADKWGKIKTIFIFISLVMGLTLSILLEYNLNELFMQIFTISFYVIVGIAVFLIIFSGTNYLIKNAKVFKEEKKEQIDK